MNEINENSLLTNGYQKVDYIRFHPSELCIRARGWDELDLVSSYEIEALKTIVVSGNGLAELLDNFGIRDHDISLQEQPQYYVRDLHEATEVIWAKILGSELLDIYMICLEKWIRYTYRGSFTVCWGYQEHITTLPY